MILSQCPKSPSQVNINLLRMNIRGYTNFHFGGRRTSSGIGRCPAGRGCLSSKCFRKSVIHAIPQVKQTSNIQKGKFPDPSPWIPVHGLHGMTHRGIGRCPAGRGCLSSKCFRKSVIHGRRVPSSLCVIDPRRCAPPTKVEVGIGRGR
jgi:hypothetical protein